MGAFNQGVLQRNSTVIQPLPIGEIPCDTREDRIFRENIINQFPEKFSLCEKYEKIAHEKSKRDANLFLLDYNKLKNKDLVFTSDDSELSDWAKAKAKAVKGFLDSQESKSTYRFWYFNAYENLSHYVSGYGFTLPVSKYGIAPVFNRLKDHKWWLRKARTLTTRELEKHFIRNGKVRRGKQTYCSNRALKKRLERKRTTRALLETLEAVNECGESF